MKKNLLVLIVGVILCAVPWQSHGLHQKIVGDITSSNLQEGDLERNIRFITARYGRVTFTMGNGSVILRGSVETLRKKRDLEQEIRALEGVREVNNLVTVRKNR